MGTSSVYLIFGATGGIGSQVAAMLTQMNNVVMAVGRKPQAATPYGNSDSSYYKQLNEISFAAVEACFTECMEKFGRLDGVVNCIGSILLKPAHLTSEQDWHNTLMINLNSAFAVVRAAGKLLTEGGAVVLMSSAASKIGLPNHEAIAAAKGGVNGLVLSAAATYAARNLRFNAVAPGLVATPLTQTITNNPKALQASIANHALGRIGQADEIARLIVWLLDPANSWMTGQIIALDGGLSSLRSRITTQAG